MPMNKIPKLREPRGPVVQQVRDKFLEQEYKVSPDDYSPEDVRLIEDMDFLLQRCVIMQRKNVDQSVKMVAQMLKWRKERRLYELSERNFPQELTLAGAGFLYEPDKYGNRTLYLRAAMCKNCSELKSALKDFLTFLMFKLDDAKDGTTYAIIMDLTGASLTNYDIELMMHIVALLKDHFPVNLDYFLAINFPWILSAAWSLIKRLIPAEKRDAVKFINSDKMSDYVDKENCPDFLGGTCRRAYSFVNPDAPNTIEYLTQQPGVMLTKKRLREILSLFSDALPKEHIRKLEKAIAEYDENQFNNNNNNSVDLSKPRQAGEQMAAAKSKRVK